MCLTFYYYLSTDTQSLSVNLNLQKSNKNINILNTNLLSIERKKWVKFQHTLNEAYNQPIQLNFEPSDTNRNVVRNVLISAIIAKDGQCGLNWWQICLITLAAVVGAVLLVLIAYVVYRFQRAKKQKNYDEIQGQNNPSVNAGVTSGD